jgi:hypothetical protein
MCTNFTFRKGCVEWREGVGALKLVYASKPSPATCSTTEATAGVGLPMLLKCLKTVSNYRRKLFCLPVFRCTCATSVAKDNAQRCEPL